MQRLLSEDQKDQRPLLCIPLFQESEQWHLQKALYMVPEIFHRRFPSYLCFLLMNHSLLNRLFLSFRMPQDQMLLPLLIHLQ